jgi:hypothetical protein
MEITYLIIFGFIVRVIVSSVTEKCAQVTTIAPKPESLCFSCMHAHIARGFRSEELTHCTHAGVSRELKFAVSDCSMFRNRNAKPELVRVIGFAGTAVQPAAPSVAARLND